MKNLKAKVCEATVLSPAKLNFHLEILGKRNDGFHSIFSIFQMISLFDSLTIYPIEGNSHIALKGDFDFPKEKNLIYAAVNLFLDVLKTRHGFSITVDKHIPVCSGLGGGSSNAAATLRALNMIYENPFSGERLLSLGASLGSDVSFFLESPAAIVTGRGEKIAPVKARSDFFIVLIVPEFSVTTREAYSLYASSGFPRRSITPGIMEKYRTMYCSSPVKEWSFHNSFYPLLEPGNPELSVIRNELIRGGALFAGLSGSGSALFGLFDTEEKARKFAGEYRKSTRLLEVVTPLDALPDIKCMKKALAKSNENR